MTEFESYEFESYLDGTRTPRECDRFLESSGRVPAFAASVNGINRGREETETKEKHSRLIGLPGLEPGTNRL